MAFFCLATFHFLGFFIAFAFVLFGLLGVFSIESIMYDSTTECINFRKSNYIKNKNQWYSLTLYDAIQIRYSIDAPIHYPRRNRIHQDKKFSVFLVAFNGDDLKIDDFAYSVNVDEFSVKISEVFQIPIIEPVRVESKIEKKRILDFFNFFYNKTKRS